MIINGKEIELKKVTVGINEKFQSIILEWSTVGANGDMQLKMENTPKANIYLVSACSGIDEQEIRDQWSTEEFDKVLQEINKKSVPSKKD
jgi:hypothetical protein